MQACQRHFSDTCPLLGELVHESAGVLTISHHRSVSHVPPLHPFRTRSSRTIELFGDFFYSSGGLSTRKYCPMINPSIDNSMLPTAVGQESRRRQLTSATARRDGYQQKKKGLEMRHPEIFSLWHVHMLLVGLCQRYW